MADQVLNYLNHVAANGDRRWRWANFSPIEMACQGTGRIKVSTDFMDKMQAIRDEYGKPITVLSGYRSPDHNSKVTGNRSRTGAHTYGRAMDVRLPGGADDVPLILDLARRHGMTRCGLQISRHHFKMHLDDMTAAEGFAIREDGRGLFCWTY